MAKLAALPREAAMNSLTEGKEIPELSEDEDKEERILRLH